MVLVELGELTDPDERERYLDFLAENDIAFVKSEDGSKYSAQITLVEPREDVFGYDDLREERSLGYSSQAEEIRRKTLLKKVVRGSRPTQETQRMLQAVMRSSDHADFSCYLNFSSLIETKTGIEPRERSWKWLVSIIHDLYDERQKLLPKRTSRRDFDLKQRFAEDKHDPALLRIFPVFVMDHISKRYGLRQIVDQMCWDLVYNVHAYRRQKLVIEVFARFLEEYYDCEDLYFFLHVKSVVDDVIQRCVRTNWTKEFYNSRQRSNLATKNNTVIHLKWTQVVSIAKVVFNPSEKRTLFDDFLSLVGEHCVENATTKEYEVESSQLLHLAVAQYHDNRALDKTTGQKLSNDIENNAWMEDIFQTAEDEYNKKLDELGIASRIAESQLESDMGYQHRLDEMCFAIKHALLNNEDTRDSLSDVNEYTIRQWAMQILGREVRAASSIAQKNYPESQQEEPKLSVDDFMGQFTRNRQREDQPTTNSNTVEEKTTKTYSAALEHSEKSPGTGIESDNVTAQQTTSTPSEQLMQEINASLARNKRLYLESLLVAADGLPTNVVYEIEKEVVTHLDKKTRLILSDLINGSKRSAYLYDSPGNPNSCSFATLSSEFKSLLKECNEAGGFSYTLSKRVDEFCQSLLCSSELRQEVEPLVALLVTYASARLGTRGEEEEQV
mmetsp:Transcript_903/g.1002  ORF Transcript_903/g.1002 Transcript_903/m.1002 type:complete len:671 (+) Transcript_903:384-2396(+)